MKSEKVRSGASIPTIIGAGLVSLLVAVSPLLFFFLVTAFGPGGILVVSRHYVSDPAGVSLEALDLNFDFIGNWEEVTVFARRPGEVRKTILFAYYPAPDVALPAMTFLDKKTIRIAVRLGFRNLWFSSTAGTGMTFNTILAKSAIHIRSHNGR